MLGRRSRMALLSSLLLLASVAGPQPTIGYIEQSQIAVSLSGPNVVRCDRTATISARVVSRRNGRPVRNQLVRWAISQSRSGGDGLSATSTVTNRRGRTSVTLSFGAEAGNRTVLVTATDTSPSITVRCAGGLPATSPRPPLDLLAAPSEIMLPDAMPAGIGAAELPVRSVRVDRLGIDLPIVEGDGQSVPEGAASHYPGTAWPGEGSNTYLYAHARDGNFLELWEVRTGDVVELEMSDGRVLDFEVSEVVPLARWDAIGYLRDTPTERLTLQTSLWYHATAPRFIVIAEPVSGA